MKHPLIRVYPNRRYLDPPRSASEVPADVTTERAADTEDSAAADKAAADKLAAERVAADRATDGVWQVTNPPVNLNTEREEG